MVILVNLTIRRSVPCLQSRLKVQQQSVRIWQQLRTAHLQQLLKKSGEGGWRVDRKRNSRARPAANNNMFGVLESVSEQPALEAAAAEVAARDAEIERLQRVVADVREETAARLAVVREEAAAEANRFSAVNRDLQRQRRDEKKIADGVLWLGRLVQWQRLQSRVQVKQQERQKC